MIAVSDTVWRWQDHDLIVQIQVQPHASRDEWLGLHGEAFRVRITAPPIEGKANAHLQGFLASLFGVAKSRVILLSGAGSRIKSFKIQQPSQLPAEIPWPG